MIRTPVTHPAGGFAHGTGWMPGSRLAIGRSGSGPAPIPARDGRAHPAGGYLTRRTGRMPRSRLATGRGACGNPRTVSGHAYGQVPPTPDGLNVPPTTDSGRTPPRRARRWYAAPCRPALPRRPVTAHPGAVSSRLRPRPQRTGPTAEPPCIRTPLAPASCGRSPALEGWTFRPDPAIERGPGASPRRRWLGPPGAYLPRGTG